LLPVNDKGKCSVYVEYDFNKRIMDPMKDTAINIYSVGPKAESTIRPAIKTAIENIANEEDNKDLDFRHLFDIIMSYTDKNCAGEIFVTGLIEAVAFAAIGAAGGFGIGSLFGAGEEGATIGAAAGLVAPTYVFIRPAYRKYKKEANKILAKKLLNYDIDKVNWIESKDLEDICDFAEEKTKKLEEKPFMHRAVERAVTDNPYLFKECHGRWHHAYSSKKDICSNFKEEKDEEPTEVIVDLSKRG
ncbi:MAG: hypothetical protein ABIB71_07915, partial [Candidatus Woesearchaeota archaeon]